MYTIKSIAILLMAAFIIHIIIDSTYYSKHITLKLERKRKIHYNNIMQYYYRYILKNEEVMHITSLR